MQPCNPSYSLQEACNCSATPNAHACEATTRHKTGQKHRSKLLEKHRLSHDALYNLHELASDLPDFVHSIRTHPDLVCVCGNKALFAELDRVLIIDSPSAQLLSYDTTFQLGDFYVSTLAFRHTLFKEAPVIPVCFLIHERKFEACHEELFHICCKLVPSLCKCTRPIVTDEEQAFANTIRCHMSLTHLRCWNHVFRAAIRWLRSHGAPAQDVAVYLSDVRDLFHLPTEEEYSLTVERMACKWSAPFYEYYSHNIHSDIHAIARWAIEPHGVYDPYSGVTSNQAEGLNYVLKQLREWHESPVDCMVLALHYLQGYYLVEISRGKQGLGNYHLHSKFSSLVQMEPPLISEQNIYSPEEIVGRIKDAQATLPPQPAVVSSHEKNSLPTNQLTQLERARHAIEENKVSVDLKLHTFTIMGTKRPHVVTLFPKETCSCPSTTECYHILAAKMSIGQNEQKERLRRLNLTQLRRNARSRKDKKSGRKRPRPGDMDLLPAPDSLAAADVKVQNMIFQGTTDNGCTVRVMQGDLTEFSADVMVNAANEQLRHDGGVAGIISRKGGPIVQEESTKYVKSAGQLSTGDAVLLKGVGNLPCKAIIHAVGPRWNGGQNNEEADLVRTVYNSLLEASKHKFMSIAFPAISSGIFGVPRPICAKAMMKGIRAFSSTDRSNQLQSITIMLLQEQHITTFTQAAGAVLKDIVHTAEIKQATASDKQIKLPTAATTSRDSDNEVQLDQPIGRLLPPAPVPNGKSDEPINADMYTCKEPPAPYWIQDLELRQQDKEQLAEGAWLTDKHINASNKLLKQQCPNQNGLEDKLVLANKLTWRSNTKDFVQIVNLNNLHWVCVANIGCPDNTIDVYDSLPANSLGSKSLQEQVAAIICTKDKFFELRFINVQRQCGSCDCALFAIANSTALCLGEDPHRIHYDQKQMRQHLKACFEARTMQLFPEHKTAPRVKRQRVCGRVTVAVYCLCRQIYTHTSDMIQCRTCKEWYHDNCVPNIGPQYWNSSQTWICQACTTQP